MPDATGQSPRQSEPLDLDDQPLTPYRVQWRSDTTKRWGAMTEMATPTAACEDAQRILNDYGGQTRIIFQHVIDVSPLTTRGAK